MKKKIIILLIILLVYLLLDHFFGIYIPCPIHYLTGLYCPGCGITRMLKSIIKLNFYQAFRYNPLLFILFPFFIILVIDYTYKKSKNRKSLYEKIPEYIWIILIVVLIIFGVLRNIIPSLAPTKI